jgi:hypothetical protein
MTTVLIIFVMIFVVAPLAKALADRLSREVPPELASNRAELARLKEEVERLSLEVARLQDEQSFMVKLVGEAEQKKLPEGRQSVE